MAVLRVSQIRISVVSGTGREPKRECLKGNLFSNFSVNETKGSAEPVITDSRSRTDVVVDTIAI